MSVQKAKTRHIRKAAGETRELHSPFEPGSASLHDRAKGNTSLVSHDYDGVIGWRQKKS